MNKTEFLESIKQKLNGLPEKDIQSAVEYYEEAIDDRTEDGLTEEQAITEIGTPDDIAEKIMMETSIPKLITAKAKPKRTLKAWEIILIIISAPVWLWLAAVLIIIFMAVIVAIMAVMIAIICVVVSLIFGGLGSFVAGIAQLINGYSYPSLALVGMALVMTGIGLFLVIPIKKAVAGLWKLIYRFIRWTKKKIIGNRKAEVQ